MARWAVVIAVALVLVPEHAAANSKLRMRGAVGAGYRRDDSFAEVGDPSDTTQLDWHARVWLAGALLRPGLLDWLAAARYGTVHSTSDDSSSRQRQLTFRASLAGLRRTRSPVTLNAVRSWTDFLSDDDNERTGRSLDTTLSATAAYRKPRLPAVTARFSRSARETRTMDGQDTNTRRTRLGLGASQGIPGATYAIDYNTSWDSGTYAESNYRSHYLLLDYSGAIPGEPAVLRLSERYYLRRPTNEAPTNPRYDDNRLSAGVEYRPSDRTINATRYRYSRFLLTIDSDLDAEDVRHSIVNHTYHRWSKTLSVTGTMGFGYESLRRDGILAQAGGNEFGAGFLWGKTGNGITFRAGGGGDIGLTSGGPDLAYGVSGNAGFFTERETFGVSATYVGAIRSGFAGDGGWTIRQQLNVATERLWGSDRWIRGKLTVAASRRESDVLGSFASRSALLSFHGRRDIHNGRLSLGFSDGLTGDLDSPGGDGLILPVEFNTHAYFGSLSTMRRFFDHKLGARLIARSVWRDAPDRYPEWQHGVGLTLVYRLGLVSMSLNEEFSVGGNGGTWRAGNIIFVRLARAFGGNS